MKVKQAATNAQNPSAWIVNPKDRGRKPIKSKNKVYLKDGKNFEIELFNPLKESVLAEIKVNGKSVSSSGLVLRPGERFYLDCFIDDKKKFVFRTYEVGNTDESKEAISLNGMIEVFFYKEETLSLNNWNKIFQPIVERHYYPYYQQSPYPYYEQYYTYTGTGNINQVSNVTTTPNYSTITTSTPTYCTNTGWIELNPGLFAASIATTDISSSLSCKNSGSFTSQLSGDINCYMNNIETGRVEKGTASKQEFTEVDMKFNSYYISHVIYQILPESLKPVETKDISKKFCTECGSKLKGSEKFCSECGTKLD